MVGVEYGQQDDSQLSSLHGMPFQRPPVEQQHAEQMHRGLAGESQGDLGTDASQGLKSSHFILTPAKPHDLPKTNESSIQNHDIYPGEEENTMEGSAKTAFVLNSTEQATI